MTDATPQRATYPAWRQRYSYEDFDRTQALAQELTDADRTAGRFAPAYGYSAENFDKARAIVREAQQ